MHEGVQSNPGDVCYTLLPEYVNALIEVTHINNIKMFSRLIRVVNETKAFV